MDRVLLKPLILNRIETWLAGELMTVFGPVSGTDCTRESGVYEVERDRLYFASVGSECYFIIVRRINVTTNYEQEIKASLKIGSLS